MKPCLKIKAEQNKTAKTKSNQTNQKSKQQQQQKWILEITDSQSSEAEENSQQKFQAGNILTMVIRIQTATCKRPNFLVIEKKMLEMEDLMNPQGQEHIYLSHDWHPP